MFYDFYGWRIPLLATSIMLFEKVLPQHPRACNDHKHVAVKNPGADGEIQKAYCVIATPIISSKTTRSIKIITEK